MEKGVHMSEVFRYIECYNTKPPIYRIVVGHLTTNGRVSVGVASGSTIAYLCILGLDPGRIEPMVPERALGSVWAMISTAIDAADVVGARLVSRCGEDGRVRLRVTLAARTLSPMLVAGVRSIAVDTLDPRGAADGGMMTPSPAALAKNSARVGIGQPDLATMAHDEDELVVDALGCSSGLGIPDLEESVASRGVRRVTNDAGNAHKVKMLGGGGVLERRLNILPTRLFGGGPVLGVCHGSETRNIDDLQEGPRHRQGDLGLVLFSARDDIVHQSSQDVDLGGPGDTVVLKSEAPREVRSHGQDTKVRTTTVESVVETRDGDVGLGDVPSRRRVVQNQGLRPLGTPGGRSGLAGGLALR